jgi:S-adenosylmethionine decarboxylase
MPRIGTHILLDGRSAKYNFTECIMSSVQEYFTCVIQEKGMTILGNIFHDFGNPKWAFTGLYLLWESHMSIHTFPEEEYIAIDLYICNMSHDASKEAREIIDIAIEYFSIQDPHIRELQR